MPSTLHRSLLLLLGSAALTLPQSLVQADENNFGYTYGCETLPRGHGEIYQWVTSRTGKADGHYQAFDLQTEFEYGFTDRLQGSFYVNAIDHDIAGVPGFADRRQLHFNGVQAALKYSLRSPYRDAWGVALYLEPGYKRYSAKSGDRVDTFFLEPKLIVQKNLLAGALIWAANFSGEFERKHKLDERAWASELELQCSTGVSYRIAPRWFVGAEALFISAFERMHLDKLGEYGIFAGPDVHYATDRWWATLTVLPQLTGWPANRGARNLANFEALQVRLKIGVNF